MVGYMHFFIEHNKGHHVHVATPRDPASSRYNENMYAFWFRSVYGSFMSAWNIEADRVKRSGAKILSWQNEMIQYLVYTLTYLLAMTALVSVVNGGLALGVMLFLVIQGILAFTLLEVVNYIEHYGIERKLLANGRYERVNPLHSWNSSYRLSNFFLFQLQRHSDHHATASKPYQVLNHYNESPQLPQGYPAMMLLSLFPPLWFKVMNPRLKEWQKAISM
jgi:alkane 1-monooxygenase